ncbi:MAG: DUF2314 domain-containing protein [Myxococcaceae bacterium]|nr:DUF2314 domain-containing protein [Myxococcaceae bacterium]
MSDAAAMKDVFVLATEKTEPVARAALEEAFAGDEVELVFGEDDCLFSVRADTSRVDVSFEVRDTPLGWSPDLLIGTPELRRLLEGARGFYRVRYTPGQPQQTVAVFEALWTVRTLMELVDAVCVDVTAFRMHSALDVEEITELDFDIRDHVTIHAMAMSEGAPAMWVHTHGLSKFGTLDVELFNIHEDDLPAAETFLHELCTDLAFGQGPSQRMIVSTSVGKAFILVPSEEARTNLPGVDPELFEGHDAQMVTVVSPEGKHSMSEMLEQYRDRFEEETEEQAQRLKVQAERLLPHFKARFMRKGLMEPLSFVVRAPFEVHPDGEDEAPGDEQLWAEVVTWDEGKVIGRLVDGGETTTEWRKGAHVEIDESQINALAVTREGRTLDADELKALLQAELPA